ncbi:hypothetical protein AB5N19_07362 [Seiridium cardinale]
MCLLVNTYQTCALFGHPTNDANATGFDAVLCDEAKSNGNTFGMCKGAVARNIPDFSSPYCTECDEVDADIHEKTKTIMEANEKSGSPETSIITEEFLTHLRGLPIDRDRAPDVSSNDMLEFLRIGVSRGVSEVDRVRAEVWAKVEKRKPDSKLENSGETREIFARWLISACGSCTYETKRVKPGLEAGAVESLHRRPVDALEQRFHDRDQRDADTGASGSTASRSTSSTQENIASNILSSLSKELPKLVNKTPQEGLFRSEDQGPPRKRTCVDGGHPSICGAAELPDDEILEFIIIAYFSHVHHWIPMIHQGSYRERIDQPRERDKLDVLTRAIAFVTSKTTTQNYLGFAAKIKPVRPQ